MKDIRQVWTPTGVLTGPVNSLVGKGESIINYNTGKATLVTLGKVGVDNQPSSVTSSDDNVIAGNDIDWIGYYGNKYNCGKSLFNKGKTSSLNAFKRPLTFALQSAPITAQIEQLNALESLYSGKNKKPELDSLARQTANVFQNNINRAKLPLLAANKEITDRQQLLHEIENTPEFSYMAKHGKDKLEHFKNGSINWTARYGVYAVPALLNLAQANYWAKQRIHTPDIYASNPYELLALTTMAGRHANPYNQWRAMLDAERRGAYSINLSGGYTGGLRLLARVAQNIGLQRNYADVLVNANKEENQYRSDWATMAANLGNQRATRRQQANQYNAESYDRAASRRATNMWKSIAGIGQNLQQGFANEFKYRSFLDMMNLYNQDLDLRLKELLAKYPWLAKNNATFTPNKQQTSTTTKTRRFGPERSPIPNITEERPVAASSTPYVNTIYDDINANNLDYNNTARNLTNTMNNVYNTVNQAYIQQRGAPGVKFDGYWYGPTMIPRPTYAIYAHPGFGNVIRYADNADDWSLRNTWVLPDNKYVVQPTKTYLQ